MEARISAQAVIPKGSTHGREIVNYVGYEVHGRLPIPTVPHPWEHVAIVDHR